MNVTHHIPNKIRRTTQQSSITSPSERLHYRNNSGGFRDTNRHFYRFGAIGSPDIVCVINGQSVGIEVKGPGGKQSDHQKQFQERLEAAGGRYILARSLDEVIADLLLS